MSLKDTVIRFWPLKFMIIICIQRLLVSQNHEMIFEKSKVKTHTEISDRTVRIWDLNNSNGPIGLLSHAGPVVAVEHDVKTNLLFSACGPFVRVWDLRASQSKAVKTLCSSGNTLSGNVSIGVTQSGESPVTALSLGASGNLYIAASDKVRIWDLQK